MDVIVPTVPANASAKAELRSEVRTALAKTASEQLRAASIQISRTIPLHSGTKCALFSGTSREPQLLSLLEREDIRWFLPRVTGPGLMTFHQVTDHCTLTAGPFGILEPQASAPEIAPEDLDLIICPGISFSTSGMRLGQGGGYYDRYLNRARKARLIGIAFDFQIRDIIPSDPHDIAMNEIITELRHLKISSQARPD